MQIADIYRKQKHKQAPHNNQTIFSGKIYAINYEIKNKPQQNVRYRKQYNIHILNFLLIMEKSKHKCNENMLKPQYYATYSYII